MAAGLFNRDKALDLAVTNYNNNSVSIFIGWLNGTFSNKVDYKTGANPSSVVVGYFDNDAYQDLLVTNYGSHTMSMLVGLENGTFINKESYRIGGINPDAIISGDLYGDGGADIIVVNHDATISPLIHRAFDSCADHA